jgi:hypothetical protein
MVGRVVDRASDCVRSSLVPDKSPYVGPADVPVSRLEGEGLWVLPGAAVRQMPPTGLQLTLRPRAQNARCSASMSSTTPGRRRLLAEWPFRPAAVTVSPLILRF